MSNAPVPPLLPVYKRAAVSFERGEGAWLFDRDGRRFLDFGSRHRGDRRWPRPSASGGRLAEQAEKALARLQPVHDPRARSAGRPAGARSPSPTRCSSATRAPRRSRRRSRWRAASTSSAASPSASAIVTFEGAFHGRTMATISAAGQDKKLVEGFDPLLPGFDIVPFGDHDALHAAIGPETAAILIEPIQGEGGIRPARAAVPRGPAAAVRRARPPADASTRCSPAWAAPARCSPTSGRGSRPTSWRSPRGWAAASRSAPASPPRAPPRAWRAGTPRLDLRRQPARLRGRQRGARRAAGERLPRPRRPSRRTACATRSSRSPPSIPGVFAEVRGQGMLRRA